MIDNLVIAIYILRKRANESSKDWLSNAIFYSSVSIMLAVSISLTFLLSLIGIDYDFRIINEKFGFDIELLIVLLLFLLIWGVLKRKFKYVTNSGIEEKVKSSRLLSEKPEVIAFSPLILIFIVLFFSLFLI